MAKNQNFKKQLIRRGYGVEEYQVENYEGMTEDEIIMACDANAFGGRVCGCYATIYID